MRILRATRVAGVGALGRCQCAMADAVREAHDAVWSQLAALPSEGDDGYTATFVNDCTANLRMPPAFNNTVHCQAHSNRWQDWPTSRPRRIFDMFLMNGEIDLMEARLAELSPYVDIFVVIEASQTHQGQPKASVVKAHWKTRFARFVHKVVHVWVDLAIDCSVWPWLCENYQREKAIDGFLRANGREDDLVIISDVDEFPRARTVHTLRWCDFETELGPTRLQLAGIHFWYSAHCRRTDARWVAGPTVATGRSLLRWGAHQLRLPYTPWGSVAKNAAKVDRGGSSATWADLSQLLPACDNVCRGHVPAGRNCPRARAHAAHNNGTLTTQPFMPFVERPSRHPSQARLRQMIERFELLDGQAIHTEVIKRASWHFSYFMTPHQIAIKYRSANVGGHRAGPSFHYRQAMRCGCPQKPHWQFEYVPEITVSEVPRFALMNRCRMRLFFRYSRNPAGWLDNDYAPSEHVLRAREEGTLIGFKARGRHSEWDARRVRESLERAVDDPLGSVVAFRGNWSAVSSPDDGVNASDAALSATETLQFCCAEANPEPGRVGRCAWQRELGFCNGSEGNRQFCPVACGLCQLCEDHPMRATYARVWAQSHVQKCKQRALATLAAPQAPKCARGLRYGQAPTAVCCPASCGTCGGPGCASRPGGRANCCRPQILHSGRRCSSANDTACAICKRKKRASSS